MTKGIPKKDEPKEPPKWPDSAAKRAADKLDHCWPRPVGYGLTRLGRGNTEHLFCYDYKIDRLAAEKA